MPTAQATTIRLNVSWIDFFPPDAVRFALLVECARFKSPLSKQQEVSAAGNGTADYDFGDNWLVEIPHQDGEHKKSCFGMVTVHGAVS